MNRVLSGPRVTIFLAVALLSISAFAQNKRALSTNVEHTPDAVIFETTEPAAAYTVRVAGPNDLRFDLQFEGDETPFVDLFDAEGKVLPDGLYIYELVATPVLEDDIREAMSKDREAASSMLKRAGLATERSSGSFRIRNGEIVDPFGFEAVAFTSNKNDGPNTGGGTPIGGGDSGVFISQSVRFGVDDGNRDQVIADDLIVQNSICVGQDCNNGESFGFDTLRLKENNLRIKFDDTSVSASFPSNDWQITANDSSNGGANKFAIDDISGGRTPFTIEASAPSHSLYVDDGGRIGLGTSTPVVELHVVNGDSPTMRLEQDGSSGFTAQTWDVAGNETNFFVRDATNGSRLPFKIRPSAPTNSLFVDTDGDIGLGTASPSAGLDILGNVEVNATGETSGITVNSTDGAATLLIQNDDGTAAASSATTPFQIKNDGAITWRMDNTHRSTAWSFSLDNSAVGNLKIKETGAAFDNFTIQADGDAILEGTLTQNSSRHIKHDFESVDTEDVLARLVSLPVTEWSYQNSSDKRHMGVMAQDFYHAFGLGQSECGIGTLDTSGVAFASIQELNKQLVESNEQKDAEIQDLKSRLERLEKLLLDQ